MRERERERVEKMENRERVRHRNQNNLVDGKRVQEQKTKSKKNSRKVEWVEPPSVLVDSRKNVVYTKRKLLGKVSVFSRSLALSLSRRYSRFLTTLPLSL